MSKGFDVKSKLSEVSLKTTELSEKMSKKRISVAPKRGGTSGSLSRPSVAPKRGGTKKQISEVPTVSSDSEISSATTTSESYDDTSSTKNSIFDLSDSDDVIGNRRINMVSKSVHQTEKSLKAPKSIHHTEKSLKAPEKSLKASKSVHQTEKSLQAPKSTHHTEKSLRAPKSAHQTEKSLKAPKKGPKAPTLRSNYALGSAMRSSPI